MRLQVLQRPMVAVILMAVTLLLSAGDLRAQSSVVVLKNGQTMAGEISRQDSKIILQTESGSRIHLAESRVLFTATTLSEAYWELSARTKPTDLEGQVGVFQWCLRNELFEEGANHLLVLQESRIPARRLAALDLDLQAKKKRADFRHSQTVERARKKQQLAERELEKAARKERVDSLIGVKSKVSIPDLHRVPLRSVRNLLQSSSAVPPKAVAVSTPAVPVGTLAPTEAIDQFGDPVAEGQIRQVSYEQPIFSAPAISNSKTASDTDDAIEVAKPKFAEPIANVRPLTNSGNVRRIPKPTTQTTLLDSGFSVQKNGGSATTSTPPQEAAKQMADPFDANYFNRRFATPAVGKK